MADPTLWERKLAPKIPFHALTGEDKERLKQYILIWNSQLEDGFPCAHRRQKRFFTEEGIEWMKLWEDYKKIMEASGFRAMSYSWFMQYVHLFNPEITLTLYSKLYRIIL